MKNTHFLQSSIWADFQSRLGHPVLHVNGIYVYVHKIGPFRYGYIPRVNAVTDDVIGLLRVYSLHWLRVEGALQTAATTIPTHARQPQTTLVLDLGHTEEALLEQMHSKTRYNIRLAERKGVTIREGKNPDIFTTLNAETTQRDGFKSHDAAYYAAFLDIQGVRQFTAYNTEGTPIATILTISTPSAMTYIHGASSNTDRQLMAPYLLQWHAIQEAKHAGCTEYDFWGIAPIFPQGTAPKETCYNGYCWTVTHPWTGITRFKVGFGGHVVSYPDAQDVVLRPRMYRLYQYIHRLKYGK
jgi:lipid II:glycine glycyltransferase (peptidoglycan interpeptide bridge formation enzyme)